MTVLLPDDLQSWTDARAAEGGFDSAATMPAVCFGDREYAERLAALKLAIDEGLASGISERTIEDIIAELRKRVGLA